MLNFLTKSITKIFGSKEERDIKGILPIVESINAFDLQMQALSEDELKNKTQQFKDAIKDAVKETDASITEIKEKLNSSDSSISIDERRQLAENLDKLEKQKLDQIEACLEEIQPEAFAVLKETCRRFKGQTWMVAGDEVKWNMVPYDVQLIGGTVLHSGKIAEMKTGEGKTLVAIFPAYLNALVGRGVHVITVNNYLAKRDAEWNKPIFEFHGLTVDCIDNHEPNTDSRRQAYRADITYGTNNEFGFDYLRDNMVSSPDQLVQREHHYAIIDEVDSILIDEARTPLIISGPVPQDSGSQKYLEMKPRIQSLVEAQKALVAGFLKEVNEKLAAGKEDEAGLALFRAHRGFPKNRQYIKMMQDPKMQKLLQKTEYFYLQDNAKNLPFVDKELYYSVDMKLNSLEMNERGLEYVTRADEDPDFFIIPDMGEETARIEVEAEKELQEKLAAAGLSKEDAAANEIKAEVDRERERKFAELNRLFAERGDRIHTVNQLLKAYTMFEKEEEYIVQDGKVNIVDEHTGRVLSGRRYSDGLHQAIEAKENVKVEAATQTYATITLQNYFRMYHKLSGMTGTAATEEGEFNEIYKLDVVVIPTNRPIIRDDKEDLIYRSKREKYNAVIQKILEYHQKGQPVLVGTTSVESSETVSRLLTRSKIPHNVLNAKQHARESEIVKAAGQVGAVTVATNMAGRGTDIKLSPEAMDKGGLAIIGTERHESRRIDLQLRGRAGRQGDPGETQFFVSLEDDLMRLFGGSDRIANVMDRMNFEDGEVLQHPWLTKSLERAQKKVEQNNFSIRKRQLEYDDVLNNQRNVIYARRRHALMGDQLQSDILNMLEELADSLAAQFQPNTDSEGLREACLRTLAVDVNLSSEEINALSVEDLSDKIIEEAIQAYKRKEGMIAEPLHKVLANLQESFGGNAPEAVQIAFNDGYRRMRVIVDVEKALESQGLEALRSLEKSSVLAVIDEKWMEHLRELDAVKEGIGLRAFAQKDPLLEYKREAFNMFRELIDEINQEAISLIWTAMPEMHKDEKNPPIEKASQTRSRVNMNKARAYQEDSTGMGMKSANESTDAVAQAAAQSNRQAQEVTQPIRAGKKYGRNEVVTIKNTATGETQSMKWKKAESLVESGKWAVI